MKKNFKITQNIVSTILFKPEQYDIHNAHVIWLAGYTSYK